jgi:uncharacterized protein YdcH (DUF465 family)
MYSAKEVSMLGENHSLTHEFPEHLDTITQLTADDATFAENAKNYNTLDKEIRQLELRGSPIDDHEMNTMKHNRAELKDWLYSKIMNA